MMKEYCVHSILDCQTSCHPTEREGFVLVDTEPSFKTLTMGTETRRPDFPTCRYSASLGGKDDKIWELFLDTNDFQLLSSWVGMADNVRGRKKAVVVHSQGVSAAPCWPWMPGFSFTWQPDFWKAHQTYITLVAKEWESSQGCLGRQVCRMTRDATYKYKLSQIQMRPEAFIRPEV